MGMGFYDSLTTEAISTCRFAERRLIDGVCLNIGIKNVESTHTNASRVAIREQALQKSNEERTTCKR